MLDQLRNALGLAGAETTPDGQEDEDPDIPAELENLQTPVHPRAMLEAADHAPLTDQDGTLPELLEAVQRYVDNHELQDRPGNAFYERLVEHFQDDNSLIEPVGVRENELCFVLTAEMWADIQGDIEFSDREIQAVRDAHQLHADHVGYDDHAALVNVISVGVRDRRLQSIIEVANIPPSRVSDGVTIDADTTPPLGEPSEDVDASTGVL